MKAIILAAGMGDRLLPLTQETPKCLLKVGGKSLLERMLDALSQVGIEEVYLVIGHQGDKIHQVLGHQWGTMPLHFIKNEEYQKGSILSLWCARDVLKDDDFLIMDADVLFDLKLLEKLIQSSHSNCVLLDQGFVDTGEEEKLYVRRGQVIGISKESREEFELVGEGVGFWKISRDSIQGLLEGTSTFIKEGNQNQSFERMLDRWMSDHTMGYELVDGFAWTEIDFVEDLEKAEHIFLPRIEPPQKPWTISRFLSSKITPYLLKTSITPNQITFANIGIALTSAFFLAFGFYWTGLIGAVFFHLFYVLGNCDGEVARTKKLYSSLGAWLDIIADAFAHFLFFPAVAIGLWHQTGSSLYLYLGASTVLGVIITFSIFMIKRKKKERKKRSQVKRGLSLVKEFPVFVDLIALFNLFGWMLWASAIGIHLFWAYVLIGKIEEEHME